MTVRGSRGLVQPHDLPKREESPEVVLSSIRAADSDVSASTSLPHRIKAETESSSRRADHSSQPSLSEISQAIRQQHAISHPTDMEDVADISDEQALQLFDSNKHNFLNDHTEADYAGLPELPELEADIDITTAILAEILSDGQTNAIGDDEDAETHERFCKARTRYWEAKEQHTLTATIALEFLQATTLEVNRLKSVREREDGTASMFIPETDNDGDTSAAESMYPRGSGYVEMAESEDSTAVGRATKNPSKRKRTQTGETKGPAKQKTKFSNVSIDDEVMFSVGSLLSHNIIGQARSNQGQASQPTSKHTIKTKVFTELMQSLAEGEKKQHQSDSDLLFNATKKFYRPGAVQSDGKGGWKLQGMKCSLRHHQVIGIAKMRTREGSSTAPYGGILSDEMGFGKTVMTLANIVDGQLKEAKKASQMPRNIQHRESKSKNHTTLIVVPANLARQWYSEIQTHVDTAKCLKSVKIFKATDYKFDSDSIKNLQAYEVLIASYNEVSRSMPKKLFPSHLTTHDEREKWYQEHFDQKKGLLHRINFHRIVLDEAHSIKNHLSKTSEAVWRLKGKYRWALSGTPVQNGLEEFFAYFRFLNVASTGEFNEWYKNYCKRGSLKADQRLLSQLRKFMIRRTHADKLFGRPLISLPEIKDIETIRVYFNVIERAIYDIVEARFRARIQEAIMAEGKKIAFALGLVLLLRLRQITDHPFLIQQTLVEFLEIEDIEKLEELVTEHQTVLDQPAVLSLGRTLQKARTEQEGLLLSAESQVDKAATLTFKKYLQALSETTYTSGTTEQTLCGICNNIALTPVLTTCKHVFCNDCIREWEIRISSQEHVTCYKCQARCSHEKELSMITSSTTSNESDRKTRNVRAKKPQFAEDEDLKWYAEKGPIWQSSKIRAAVDKLEQWWKQDPTCKIIIFTQFRGVIRILSRVCNEKRWPFVEFHGGMSMDQRDQAIQKFTNDLEVNVFLSGLKAGGVGLNLTAANRVLIVDLWWNASIEEQAYCRAFRIGQTRAMEVARLVVDDSVDMRLMQMQERKTREISKVMGKKGSTSNMTADDLLDLFGPLTRNAAGDVIDGGEEEPFIVSDKIVDLSYEETEERQEVQNEISQLMQKPMEDEDEDCDVFVEDG